MPIVPRLALAAASLVLIGLLVACGSRGPAAPTGSAIPAATGPDTRPAPQPSSAKASEEVQAKRKAALDKAKANDVLDRLNERGMWIKYNWHIMEPKGKQALAAVAWLYLHAALQEGNSESYPPLVIYNSSGDKKIGTYHPSTGLQLDP